MNAQPQAQAQVLSHRDFAEEWLREVLQLLAESPKHAQDPRLVVGVAQVHATLALLDAVEASRK